MNYCSNIVERMNARLKNNFEKNRAEKKKQEEEQTRRILEYCQRMEQHENTPPTVQSIAAGIFAGGCVIGFIAALTYVMVKLNVQF